MNFNRTYINRTAVFVLFTLTILIFSTLYIASCTDRIKNEKTPNPTTVSITPQTIFALFLLVSTRSVPIRILKIAYHSDMMLNRIN